MKMVNMHEAKTHLSSLVHDATQGEPFAIAKNGVPQVVVYAYVANSDSQKRVGFMPDIVIPDDFDSIMSEEISELFLGES